MIEVHEIPRDTRFRFGNAKLIDTDTSDRSDGFILVIFLLVFLLVILVVVTIAAATIDTDTV